MRRAVMMAMLPLAAALASPAAAQDAPEHCPENRVAFPAELAGWASPAPLSAAADAAHLDGATLTLGAAANATLRPTGDIHYVAQPGRPGTAGSFGGMFAFAVAQAGPYRVAIGSAAWIDVVGGGSVIASSGHSHGPACSGIRKMVDFALTPGHYVLQIAASGAATLPVMVVRLP